MSAPLQNIGAVQSRRVHTDTNAVSHWRRWGLDLQHTDSFDPAMRCDDNRTHQSGYSSRAWIQTNDWIVPVRGCGLLALSVRKPRVCANSDRAVTTHRGELFRRSPDNHRAAG